MAQTVKRLPAMWETRVRFPGWEDPLEKAMAPHSSTLAWKIPWTEEPDRLQSMGSQRVRHDWATSISLFTFTLHIVKLFKKHLGQLFVKGCLPILSSLLHLLFSAFGHQVNPMAGVGHPKQSWAHMPMNVHLFIYNWDVCVLIINKCGDVCFLIMYVINKR